MQLHKNYFIMLKNLIKITLKASKSVKYGLIISPRISISCLIKDITFLSLSSFSGESLLVVYSKYIFNINILLKYFYFLLLFFIIYIYIYIFYRINTFTK